MPTRKPRRASLRPTTNPYLIKLYAPFKHPLPIPSAGVFDEPTISLCLNEEWIAYLLGALQPLTWDDLWEGTDIAVKEFVLGQVQALIHALMSGESGCMLIRDIRVNPTTGELEKTYDGETWIPLANWVDVPGDTMTGDLTLRSGAASGAHLNINPTVGKASVNVRLPSGDTTHNVMQIVDASATTRYSVNSIGRQTARGDDNNMYAIQAQDGAIVYQVGTVAGNPILTLRGRTSQTADILRVLSSAGITLAAVSNTGALLTRGGVTLRGTSTVQERDMAALRSVWEVQTDDSRRAQVVISTFDAAGERQVLRGGTDGAAAKIGFLGADPVTRPVVTGERAGNPALASFLSAGAALGLFTDNTTVGTAPSDGADGASVELRVHDGYIQWRQDDDDPTWANLVALADLVGPGGPQGPQGDPGADGADGQDGECTGCGDDPGNPPGEPSNDKRCGIAIGLTDWIQAIHDDHMSQLAAYVTVVNAALDIAQSFVGLQIAGLLNVGTTAVGIGIAVINSENNVDFWETVRCKLYCLLPQSGTINESIITQWGDSLVGLNDVGYIPVRQLIQTGISFQEYRRRAYAYSLAPSSICEALCDECACEELTLNPPNATTTNTIQSAPTVDGANYTITISGVMNLDAGANFQMDACYGYGVDNGQWRDNRTDFYFSINGSNVAGEKPYSSSHTYTFTRVGDGDPFVFEAYDIGVGNNSGAFTIEICREA